MRGRGVGDRVDPHYVEVTGTGMKDAPTAMTDKRQLVQSFFRPRIRSSADRPRPWFPGPSG